MKLTVLTSTIAAAGDTGSAVSLLTVTGESFAVASIFLDAAFDDTALTFLGSHDGSTWVPVIKTDGSALSYAVTASTAQAISVPPTDLCGFPHLKPKAGSANTAETIVTFVVRPV